MTMHLLGPAFSTISTKKRRNKDVTINAKYTTEFREHNKLMRRTGCKEKSLEEYIQYRQGKTKPALRGTPMPKYEVSNHRQKYPSGDGIGTTYARKEKVYTGTLIKGISTLHKSNAVPVINDEQILEIAKMRRG
jgi:hypothetical protein